MICNKFYITILVLSSIADSGLLTDLPEYLIPCKWEKESIDDCVKGNLERLSRKLKYGIPNMGIPSFKPFCVEEEVRPNIPGMSLTCRNVKITGADEFIVKNLHFDLDKSIIKAKLLFPKLHIEGDGVMQIIFLTMPLKASGKFVTDAVRTTALNTMHFAVVERDGVDYMHINESSVSINVKSYDMRMNGLFKDKFLSETFHSIMKQRNAEMFEMSRPYLESLCNKIVTNTINNFTANIPLDSIFENRKM